MPHYRVAGDVPPKRHTQHRGADGALLFEELMGEEGFSSDSSLLYHRFIPSAVAASRVWELPDQSLVPNHPLLPRHLSTHSLSFGAGTDAVTGRRLLLGNADVRISYVVADAASPLYRNGIGDECLFVESGSGVVETVFGDLAFGPGDYVVVPRATTHRIVPSGQVRIYAIEGNSHITSPKRYLSKFGQLLEHAPYCERDLRGPTGLDTARSSLAGHSTTEDQSSLTGHSTNASLVEPVETEVYIKHRVNGLPGGIGGTVHTLPHHPFDVVGWDGCLYPFAFNVDDFMPITGKVHQPPPVHQVFEGTNFVICNFVPRKVDYHPLSIPVPYYHSNVDSDEVMFYVAGDYEARKGSGIAEGSITLHPGGHPHGPQPGAYERSIGVEYFDELAVMVDTFRPLDLGEAGREADDGVYAGSWSSGDAR